MKRKLHFRKIEITSLNRFSMHLLFVCCLLFSSTFSNAHNSGEPENSNNPASFLRPPVNDDCINAINIPPNSPCGIVSGDSNTGTQSQPGCLGTANDDVWFRFTPLSTSPTITVAPGGADPIQNIVLEAFSGTCGTLTSIGCINADNTNGGTEAANFTGLTIGTEYFIRIYSFASQNNRNGEFDICLTDATPPPPLANDVCTSATSLTPSANTTCNTVTGGTLGANTEFELGECSIAGIAYDVWYSFMATSANHDVIVDGIAGFDAVITSVSTCNTTTSPAGGGACVDATVDNGIETMNLTGLTIGNTYYVQVQDFNGDQTVNAFTICVTTPAPPPTPPINDNCPGAIDLPPNSPCGIVSGDSNFGTQSQPGCAGTANDDVWFRFTPLSSSPTITITPNGADPINDIVLEAFTGTCGSLTSIGCVDATVGAAAEGANFTGLTIGTEYFIRVYSYFAATADNGEFDICLTDSTPTGYCTPTTQSPAGDYINSVQFLGSLNDIDNLNNGFSNGYQDFTGLAAGNSEQQQGEGINVYIESANSRGRFKAWIDWNNDLAFNEATEKVYDSGGIMTVSTTFGFVIPLAQAPGTYVMRIRFYHESNDSLYWDFTPCQNFVDGFPFSNEYGEAEDYEFDVLARCDSDVVDILNGEECGTNAVVTVGATGSAGVTEYYWYANETDRDALNPVPLRLGTTFNIGATQNTTWDTPSISTTTIYWVTAWNGTCESYEPERVIAFLHQPATLSFTPTLPFICGEGGPRIEIAALSNTQIEFLIDEDFNATGSLGSFTATNITSNGGSTVSQWQQHPSTPPYIPSENVWFPAISSGFGADNGSPNNGFALSNADTGFVPTENELESAVLDASTHINLTLEFDMYFSRYNLTVPEYIYIEASLDGGATYLPANRIATITDDVGYGTDFEHRSYNLDAYAGQANLRIRVYYYSEWGDGVAIDNIQLYGQTSISPLVTWTSAAFSLGGIYQNATGGALYTGAPASSIWIQPSRTQLQASDTWDFSASVTLANGCTASGTVSVENRTRYFEGATNDWSVASNWKPAFVPTSVNCVIVPNTFTGTIAGTYDADAYNVLVENGGEILAQAGATLTVVDEVIVAPTGYFELEGVQQDTAQLIQVNDVNNTGNITLFRETNVRNQDYVYWSSPVENFSLGSISNYNYRFQWVPTVLTNLGFHGEWSAYSGIMTEGKGYIVRGPNGNGNTNDTPQWNPITFPGVPNNGDVSIAITRGEFTGPTFNQGPGPEDNITAEEDNWNLIGNPYPSAIDADLFLSANTNLDGTVYLWTHGTKIQNGVGSPFYGTYSYNYNQADYLEYNSSGSNPPGFLGSIGSGQGFFVQMLHSAPSTPISSPGSFVNFTNSMRDRTLSAQFFKNETKSNKTEDLERHRIWLDLVTPAGHTNTTLIAYAEGATIERDRRYDALIIGGYGKNLYSFIGDETYSIQGRSIPLDVNDVVPLGTYIDETGVHAIAINTIDGLFETTEQGIFIEDLDLGVIHNLKLEPYFFTASETGSVDDRFVIRYTDNSLSTEEYNLTSGIAIIAPNSDYIKVTSATNTIDNIIVYDILGRVLIDKKDVNANTFSIENNKLSAGALIVKATLVNGKQKIQKVVLKK